MDALPPITAARGSLAAATRRLLFDQPSTVLARGLGFWVPI
jgi:hypothetical protein